MTNPKEISQKRKNIYLLGQILAGIGLVMFLSTFIIHAINFGNFENFDRQVRTQSFLSIGGMILMIIGGGLQSIGRKGVAGSGLVLDTEQERRDLEPINRMVGGQINDTLEEVNLKKHLGLGANQMIKIRCQSCRHLNDEEDRFCGGCGKRI